MQTDLLVLGADYISPGTKADLSVRFDGTKFGPVLHGKFLTQVTSFILASSYAYVTILF